MLKFMKKIPGGLLLIPMLISALFHTFLPDFFVVPGITEAIFTTKGTNYIVGLICFLSSTAIDIKNISKVLKKQGTILLLKIFLCFIFGIIFIKIFGLDGVFGISALAFITCICSINPSLYLALSHDYGNKDDEAAFGLTGILCVPAFPILVYSISKSSAIDWTPVISVLIPIVLGILIGNLDKDMAKFFTPAVTILTPFMGWSFGAGINIIEALKAGPQGILVTILFYLLIFPPIFFYERKILKENGITTFGISSIAGLSVSVPTIIAHTDKSIGLIANTATAQIALGVVLTSIITPILTGIYTDKKKIKKNT
ncbi:2-keto-3-deoxygluconate permease [Anaerococcus sp. WCA-380-WT-2B]|uniref:2-keto-3-deoxygluconate permease n=1 Tax=Anaerococcus porci TaxID=2652269 RepID=A0A6N7VTS1_9FIRM|nr:2-keto-3-deoxygluconate permease [Anaerococcus porci]MSS77454.1 2-keto-3-deoxygluconate permease [Anaerococcus porci]